MFTWVKWIIALLYVFPMILFSLMLFRLRIKPYWKQISLAGLAGSIVMLINDSPLLVICIICILLMAVWRYRMVPALLIALSGYILSVLVATTVLVSMDLMQVVVYSEFRSNLDHVVIIRILVVLTKFSVIFALFKLRLGFTFLSNYTKIPVTRENAGVYLFILVVLLGIASRDAYPDSVFSALMPIQMLSMATVLFVYAMLGKEIGVHR